MTQFSISPFSKRFKTVALFAFVSSIALVGSSFNARASEETVTIGTAGVTGVYYPAGGAICRLVNRGRKEHGVRCTVESTGGSINNLEMIEHRDLELGVVQSDLLYAAYNGTDMFSDVGSDSDIRGVFALHPEPFTIVVRKAAKIKNFDQLKGKRVYMGAPGSGMRATMEEIMKYKGWTPRSFKSVDNVKMTDQSEALCSGKIDAMVYAGGHPNGAIQQITSMCDAVLLDVGEDLIAQLIEAHPYYSRAVIPAGMYSGNRKDIDTFGVKAILAASEDLDDETVYIITKAVFDNIENFKTLHPVFATLNPQMMALSGDNVPIHNGAMKYFKETGLID